MGANIVGFRKRALELKVAAGLTMDELVEELERLSLAEVDRSDTRQLLDLVRKVSDLVVDLGYLVFDGESMQRLERAFNALSATIAEARVALDAHDRKPSP